MATAAIQAIAVTAATVRPIIAMVVTTMVVRCLTVLTPTVGTEIVDTSAIMAPDSRFVSDSSARNVISARRVDAFGLGAPNVRLSAGSTDIARFLKRLKILYTREGLRADSKTRCHVYVTPLGSR